jgi:hypothetical protein
MGLFPLDIIHDEDSGDLLVHIKVSLDLVIGKQLSSAWSFPNHFLQGALTVLLAE